ncbi:MAG: hypothetical protein MZW92_18640, partial [Comamonadaceae bacterium]|nr:hypothetical protein [Comamonadaceae bacterium]
MRSDLTAAGGARCDRAARTTHDALRNRDRHSGLRERAAAVYSCPSDFTLAETARLMPVTASLYNSGRPSQPHLLPAAAGKVLKEKLS